MVVSSRKRARRRRKSEAQTRERTKRSTSFAGEAEAATRTGTDKGRWDFPLPTSSWVSSTSSAFSTSPHHIRRTRVRRADRRRLQQEQGSPGLLTLAESALHLHLASTLLHVVDHPLLLSIVAAERCHWLHDGHPPAQPVSVQKTLHESTCTHTRKVMAPDARSALPFSCLLHSAFQPSSPSHWWPAPRSRCFSKSSSDCQYPGLIMTLAKLFQLTSTNNVHTHRVAGVCSISKPPGPLNSAGPER